MKSEAIMPDHHESVAEHAGHHAAWKAAQAARHPDFAKLAAAGVEAGYKATCARLELAEHHARIKQASRAREQASRARAERPELVPLSFDDRSANALRPSTFEQMVGQTRLKGLVSRIIKGVAASGAPLDHMLLAGASGTGKTTFAQVVAHELGRTVYQVKAPVSHAVLEELGRVCTDGDVIIIDEVHQQVTGDRRGISQTADPEDYYHVMEDRRLPTEGGMIPYPAVTFIGATTDEGLLPEAFLNRFPLRLTLDPYTWDDMTTLAVANADALGCKITNVAAEYFGRASRRNPRQLNTYVRNAISIGGPGVDIYATLADEVIMDLNGCTADGLTIDMQKMLRHMLAAPKCSASVSSIATALGHSRDTKAVALFVEPYLIAEGYVNVAAGVGRVLTPTGIQRAQGLQ